MGGPPGNCHQVEDFDPQLKIHRPAERDVAANNEIQLTHRETAEGAPPEGSLAKRIAAGIDRRRGECCAVEPPPSRHGGIAHVQRDT